MSEDHWDDRFIQMLLDEELAGETPADDSEAILRRCRRSRRVVQLRWWAAAVAACLVCVGGYWWQARGPGPTRYPAPQIAGACRVEDGGPLQRGARVLTEEAPGTLQLGGYVDIDFGPQTIAQVQGKDQQEELVLEQGKIECSVEKDRGRFLVRTELGSVLVVGTRFTVEVVQEENTMELRKLIVKVLAGVVLITGAGETGEFLHAGEGREVQRQRGNQRGGDWGRRMRQWYGQQEKEQEPTKTAAIHLYEKSLEAKIEACKEKAFDNPTVKKAMETAVLTSEKTEKLLKAKPQYAELQKAVTMAEEQERGLVRPTGRDRGQWQEFGRQWRELHEQTRTAKNTMQEFVATDPELAKIKTAEEEAWLKLLETYKTTLEADPDYKALQKKLEQAKAWVRAAHEDQWRKQRQEREARRAEQEKKEKEAVKENVEKAPEAF